MRYRSDDPSHHERTLLPRNYISLQICTEMVVCGVTIINRQREYCLKIRFWRQQQFTVKQQETPTSSHLIIAEMCWLRHYIKHYLSSFHFIVYYVAKPLSTTFESNSLNTLSLWPFGWQEDNTGQFWVLNHINEHQYTRQTIGIALVIAPFGTATVATRSRYRQLPLGISRKNFMIKQIWGYVERAAIMQGFKR